MCVCVCVCMLYHAVVQQKLTQHCKAIAFKQKKNVLSDHAVKAYGYWLKCQLMSLTQVMFNNGILKFLRRALHTVKK